MQQSRNASPGMRNLVPAKEQKVPLALSDLAPRWRFFGLLMIAVLCVTSVLFIMPPAQAASTAWRTFHDPLYGFSLSYPDTWLLTPELDGSHITLLNPATQTTLSPLVTTQPGTPAAALQQATPAGASGLHIHQVAGHPAVDYLLPYISGPKLPSNNAVAPAPSQTRLVILPVARGPSSTTVYTFQLTQPTDAMSNISAAEQADNTTFDAILNTFTLPAPSASATPSTVASLAGCNRVCWADANWNYTRYDDTASLYCGLNEGYPNGYWATSCPNGATHTAVQLPGGTSAGNAATYWQPNFQCADFVSRALTQDGLVPGYNNGGVNGSFPANPPIGSSSYQNYNASGTTYNLIDVGVPGIPGLYDYLVNTGLGTDIGHNVAGAAPGDVVFIYSGTVTPANRIHVIILTGLVQDGWSVGGGWNAYTDSHNAAAYHYPLSGWVAPGTGQDFAIIHLKSSLSSGRIGSHNDFNGDGKSDVMGLYNLGTQSNGANATAAYEWLSTGTNLNYQGQIWSSVPSGFTWSAAKWVSGDFNSDGKADIMAMYNLGTQSDGSNAIGAYEWLGTSSGLSYQGRIWSSIGLGGFTWGNAQFVAGDFNGDGKDDIIAMYNLGTTIGAYEWLSTGTGLSYQGRIYTSGTFTWANAKWVSGDFNGDGKDDIMALYNLGTQSNGKNAAALYEWLSTGTGLDSRDQVWSSVNVGGFTWASATLVAGDFNGDGKADIMALYNLGIQSNGSNATGAYEWLSTGTSVTYLGQVWSSVPSGFTWAAAQFVTGDFNGDGKADIMALYNLGIQQGVGAIGAYEWLGTSSGLSYRGQIWSSIGLGGFTWTSCVWVP